MRLFYFFLALAFVSCDIFDEDEPVPSFVYIDSGDLIVNAGGSQGDATFEVIDAHVFANDFFVGTIELPGQVPILNAGSTKITIGAGIRNNGIFTDRIIYPFYQFLETNIVLEPGVVHPISSDSVATFQYFPGANILHEGFEGIGNVWAPLDPDGTAIVNTSDQGEVLVGSSSGKIVLTNEFPNFEVVSQDPEWDLSGIIPSRVVYMELDYKGNNPLEIGIRTRSPQVRKIFALGLNPTDEWTKIYVELTNEIGQGQTNDFQIYLESIKSTVADEAIIFVDNMKVVY
jgi:hypothetical protein